MLKIPINILKRFNEINKLPIVTSLPTDPPKKI